MGEGEEDTQLAPVEHGRDGDCTFVRNLTLSSNRKEVGGRGQVLSIVGDIPRDVSVPRTGVLHRHVQKDACIVELLEDNRIRDVLKCGAQVDRPGLVAGSVVRIGVVAHTIAISVCALRWVVRESIGVVTNTVTVCVGGLTRIVGEGVGVITHTIAICVCALRRIVRESIGVVTHAVTVAVDNLACIIGESVGVVTHTVVVGVRPFRRIKWERVQ